MFDGQLLRLARISANEDFRSTSFGANKGCIERAIFDFVIFAFKVYRRLILPKCPADSEKFIGALIPLIMLQKIPIGPLFCRSMSSNNIETDPPIDKC